MPRHVGATERARRRLGVQNGSRRADPGLVQGLKRRAQVSQRDEDLGLVVEAVEQVGRPDEAVARIAELKINVGREQGFARGVELRMVEVYHPRDHGRAAFGARIRSAADVVAATGTSDVGTVAAGWIDHGILVRVVR